MCVRIRCNSAVVARSCVISYKPNLTKILSSVKFEEVTHGLTLILRSLHFYSTRYTYSGSLNLPKITNHQINNNRANSRGARNLFYLLNMLMATVKLMPRSLVRCVCMCICENTANLSGFAYKLKCNEQFFIIRRFICSFACLFT